MISKEEVQHIADLARIGLSEKELEKFSGDFSAILDWMEELKKADISEIKPGSDFSRDKNTVRQDKILEFSKTENIKKMFPEEKSGYDKVKSVL